jgi:hypothetical protein
MVARAVAIAGLLAPLLSCADECDDVMDPGIVVEVPYTNAADCERLVVTVTAGTWVEKPVVRFTDSGCRAEAAYERPGLYTVDVVLPGMKPARRTAAVTHRPSSPDSCPYSHTTTLLRVTLESP